MDTAASGNRYSAFSPGAGFDDSGQQPADPPDKTFKEGYAMAAPSAGPPSGPYHKQQSAPYPHSHPPPANMAPLVSPVEARRASDESESAHRQPRQSLPSLAHLMSTTNPIPIPHTASTQGPPAPAHLLPPPFASAPSRSFSDSSTENRPSPQLLHPSDPFSSRPEPPSSFSDSGRPPLSARTIAPPPPPPPPPPPSLLGGQQPSLPAYHERNRETEVAQQQLNGAYPHPSQQQIQPPQPLTPLYPQSGQLPPGQLPLPPPPFSHASPRQANSGLSSVFESARPPILRGDEEASRNRYEGSVPRGLDSELLEAMHKIGASSRILFNFAEAFDVGPRTGTPLPSRLPNDPEIRIMMENAYLIQKGLEEVAMVVQQSRMHNERTREMARETGIRKPGEEEDVAMFNDSHKVQQQSHHLLAHPHPLAHQHHPHPHPPLHQPPSYTLADVKKRRGRAAPPGRCHSCNRVDTPEWRRGPDGARTLCNACGLHYAKLERKRQSEQRTIRPKPAHEP